MMKWPSRVLPALLIVLSLPAFAAAPVGADTRSWDDLRGYEGVVVLMRHALAPGGGDPPGFRLGDCRTQRDLSREGREQARRIGQAIIDSRVKVVSVLASPWCRSKDTATLLGVGPVVTRGYLGSTFTAPSSVADKRESRTRRLIESHRGKDGVVLVVSHYANIVDLTGTATDSGEALAVRMDEGGEIVVLDRIPAP